MFSVINLVLFPLLSGSALLERDPLPGIQLWRSSITGNLIGIIHVEDVSPLWVEMDWNSRNSVLFVGHACPYALSCLGAVMHLQWHSHELSLLLGGREIRKRVDLCNSGSCLTAPDVAGVIAWSSRDHLLLTQNEDGTIQMTSPIRNVLSNCVESIDLTFLVEIPGAIEVDIRFDPNILIPRISTFLASSDRIELLIGAIRVVLTDWVEDPSLDHLSILMGMDGIFQQVEIMNGQLCFVALCNPPIEVSRMQLVARYDPPSFSANDEDLVISFASSETGSLILRNRFSADWLLFYDLGGEAVWESEVEGWFRHPGYSIWNNSAPKLTDSGIVVRLARIDPAGDKAVQVRLSRRHSNVYELSFTADMFRRRNKQKVECCAKTDDSICSICHEELEVNGNEITKLSCSHNFHAKCIHLWIKRNPTCPECRNSLNQIPRSRLVTS